MIDPAPSFWMMKEVQWYLRWHCCDPRERFGHSNAVTHLSRSQGRDAQCLFVTMFEFFCFYNCVGLVQSGPRRSTRRTDVSSSVSFSKETSPFPKKCLLWRLARQSSPSTLYPSPVSPPFSCLAYFRCLRARRSMTLQTGGERNIILIELLIGYMYWWLDC